jgi:glycosyltransferase involved in cell wall biosynthesis
MINPCGIKGLSIFVALAQAFPDRAFAAVPTWGTSPVDLETLARLPNVSILPAVDDVGVIYAQTRVLVVPSLCPEGLSNVVVEAMLRGIPVLASDLGGLPEATQGAGVLLPVRPIEGFRLQNGLPVARAIPEQDATPWCDALAVLDDQTAYAGACARAQSAAIAFARSTSVEPYERLFATLARRA